MEKSGVNIKKKIRLMLHSRQKIPTVKIIKQSFQENSCPYLLEKAQPIFFINVLRGSLTLVLGVACVTEYVCGLGGQEMVLSGGGKGGCPCE